MNNINEWIDYNNIHLTLKYPNSINNTINQFNKIYSYHINIGIANSLKPINSIVSNDAIYSFSIVFYSEKTRMFYGRQYFSKGVKPFKSENIEFNEDIFFISRYNDDSCIAVIEFFAEDKGDIKSCGYSTIPIFNNPQGEGVRDIYNESVRNLLVNYSSTHSAYSKVTISARRFEKRNHLLKWYVPENCPFSKFDYPSGVIIEGRGADIEDIKDTEPLAIEIDNLTIQTPLNFESVLLNQIAAEYNSPDGLPNIKDRIIYASVHNGWTTVGSRKQIILQNRSSDILYSSSPVQLQRWNKDNKTCVLFELVYIILLNGEERPISCGIALYLPNATNKKPKQIDLYTNLKDCDRKIEFLKNEFPAFYNVKYKFNGDFIVGFNIGKGFYAEGKEDFDEDDDFVEENKTDYKITSYPRKSSISRRPSVSQSYSEKITPRPIIKEDVKDSKPLTQSQPKPQSQPQSEQPQPQHQQQQIIKEQVSRPKNEEMKYERDYREEFNRERYTPPRHYIDDSFDRYSYEKPRRPKSNLDLSIESDSGDDLEEEMLYNNFLSKAMKTLLKPSNFTNVDQPFVLEQVKHYSAYQPSIIGNWENSIDLNIPTSFTKPITRAAKAELAKYGITGNNDSNYINSKEIQTMPPEVKTEFHLEESDTNTRNQITIHFSMIESIDDSQLPESLYFQFKFYTYGDYKSKNHYLLKKNDNISMLVADNSQINPPVCAPYKITIDYNELSSYELPIYYDYMSCKSLYINVFDGDSRLFLGYILLPLKQLLRQQKPYVSTSQYYPINGLKTDGQTPIQITNTNIVNPILGRVVITTCCTGEKGRNENKNSSYPIHTITTNKEYFTHSYGIKSDIKVPIRVRLMEEVDPSLKETLSHQRQDKNVRSTKIISDESEISFSTLDIIMQRYRNLDRNETMSARRLLKVISAYISSV